MNDKNFEEMDIEIAVEEKFKSGIKGLELEAERFENRGEIKQKEDLEVMIGLFKSLGITYLEDEEIKSV